MRSRAGGGFRQGGCTAGAFACATALLATMPAPARADSDAGTSTAPTVTRLVQAFSELEHRLDEEAATHDAAAFDRLLAPDFEVRNAARPSVPLPRAQFIERLQSRVNAPARIEQMAVHDFGSMAVVSFAMRRGASDAPASFVIDVWSRLDGQWQLRVRYLGPGGSQAAIPDETMPDSRDSIPKKY